MKLTVGPLPAAVYWRRRAVVLAAALAVVLWLGYACSGSDSGAHPANGSKSPSPTPVVYPSEDPPGDPPPDPGGDAVDPTPEPSAETSAPTAAGSGNGGTAPLCADGDLRIAPRPTRTETPEGARLRIDLVITNVSERACRRDIGADQQELRVMRGTSRIWSSDDCNPQAGSQVEVLPPGRSIERFWVTWDGRTSAPKCAGERTVAPAGSYTVVARLGQLVSKPVALKVVAA